MQRPDFRTFNVFRSQRLQDLIDPIFVETILFLAEHKYITLDKYFVDGTVIAANANKHSYVRKKNTQRHKANTLTKIRALLTQIEQTNRIENDAYGDRDLEELGNETTLTSDALNARLQTATTPVPTMTLTEAAPPPTTSRHQQTSKSKALKDLETKSVCSLDATAIPKPIPMQPSSTRKPTSCALRTPA